MRTTRLISTLLIWSLSSTVALAASLAQVDGAANPDTQAQKYNGYGLPNTKFKKVKVKNVASPAPSTAKTTTTMNASADASTATKKIAPNVKAAQIAPAPGATTATLATPSPAENAKAAAAPTPFFGFSVEWISSYNSQMQTQPDGKKDEYIQHEVTPKLKMGDYTLTGDFYYNDHFKYPDQSDYDNSTVIFGRKAWELGSYVKLAPSAGVLLPLARSLRDDQGVKSAVFGTLTLGMNSKNLGLDKWSLSWASSYYKFQTEFDTTPAGAPTFDYRLRQQFSLGYSFTEKFSFLGIFRFDSNYFQQGVVKNKYLHAEIFSYQFIPMVAVFIEHDTGNAVYSISGPDDSPYLENSLKFYDPQASELAIGIDLNF